MSCKMLRWQACGTHTDSDVIGAGLSVLPRNSEERTKQFILLDFLFDLIWLRIIQACIIHTYLWWWLKKTGEMFFYYCWNCEWTTDVKAYFFNVSVLLKLIAKLKKLFPLHIQNIIAKHITTILHFQFILKQCKLRPTILSFILRQK